MTIAPSSNRLESLVAAHVDLVYAAALRQVRDPHLADDVTQTVFLLLARKFDQDSPPAESFLAPWLIKVTRYTALTALRQARRRQVHESRAPQPAESREQHDILLADLLDEALMALGESDRQLIVLRYMQNRTVPEVASALHLRTNTAAKRLERALERMRRFLERRGLGSDGAGLAIALPGLARRSAPPQLAARILNVAATNAPATVAVSVPVGVLLMTAATKTKIAAIAAALALLVGGGYLLTHYGISHPAAPLATESASVITITDSLTTLSGIVNDATGKPVAGALVTQGDSPFDVEFRRARSDADGRFQLPNVRVGADLALSAQAPGFAPALFKGTVTEQPPPFSFSLQPGNMIRLKLVDARGLPLSNVQVEPMLWRDTEVLRQRRRRPEFVTDKDGIIVWHEAPEDEVKFDTDLGSNYLRKAFILRPSDELQTVTVADPIPITIKVVDADTGLPLPKFSLTTGWGEEGTGQEYFDSSAVEINGGETKTSLASHVPRHLFRVEAPGYTQAVQSVREAQTIAPLEFRLHKAGSFELAVLQPDGTPAAKVITYVTPQNENFHLDEMMPFHRADRHLGARQRAYVTNDFGKATIVDQPDAQLQVVISTEAGFASLPLTEAANGPIKLDSWARLEGQVFIGVHPVANQRVTANYGPASTLQAFVHGSFAATTDADGHFVIDRVPPRRLNIGRDIEMDDMGTTTANMMVNPRPGETVQVTLGGKGRPVVGKITGQDGKPMSGIIAFIGSLNSPPRPRMSQALMAKLATLQHLSAEEARKGYAQFRPEIDVFNKSFDAWRNKAQYNSFALQHDGTFHADDIEAGEWELELRVQSKSGDASTIVQTIFTVPPMPDGRSDDPLDVGTIIAPALVPLRKP